MPGTKEIPLDLAFSRWMGSRNNVIMMPLSFYYHPSSKHMQQNYVSLDICKDLAKVEKACLALRKISLRR